MQGRPAKDTTPLWKREVEDSGGGQGYYVVIPETPEHLRDPYLAPHLRKWLVLNSILLHLQMGATPVLLIPMGRSFRASAATLGIYGGSFYLSMSIGGAVSNFLFRKYRIHQLLTLSAAGASASAFVTACLPAPAFDCTVPLVLLRLVYGLCQALLMAHSNLWAKRTAPREHTRAWLTVFQVTCRGAGRPALQLSSPASSPVRPPCPLAPPVACPPRRRPFPRGCCWGTASRRGPR